MKFFDYAFTNGDKAATELEYVPMPKNVTAMIRNVWKNEIKGPNGQAIWK
jgi:phosphate transport system substrate-binding protein